MRWRRAVERELDAVVAQAFGCSARADAGRFEQVHGDLLQHAGADAAQHVVAAAPLEDDVVDAGLVQQWPSSRPAGPAPMIATWVRAGIAPALMACRARSPGVPEATESRGGCRASRA